MTVKDNMEIIRIKGHDKKVESILVDNKSVISTGVFPKIAKLRDEWYEEIGDPLEILEAIKESDLRADIFTFMQKPPNVTPLYDFYHEWDNIAAVQISDYDNWWTRQISPKTRNVVRKAEKEGVVVRLTEFNDDLLMGISKIYNESPIRQGKPFWHYGKDLGTLKKIHETFLDRADFIGAYYEGELIGFIKLVYSGETANTMHIISMVKHHNKSPTNALVAKAVDICAQKRIRYLVYDKFSYGNAGSKSLLDFKRHNGFEKIDLPRYFVPLNILGKISLKMNIHNGVMGVLPPACLSMYLNIRKNLYERKYRASKPAGQESH